MEDAPFYLIFALMLWVVSVPATLMIANSKGKSLLAWGIAAFFFGFFALLLAALTPAQKRCPKCAEYVALEAKVCKHCRSELEG